MLVLIDILIVAQLNRLKVYNSKTKNAFALTVY